MRRGFWLLGLVGLGLIVACTSAGEITSDPAISSTPSDQAPSTTTPTTPALAEPGAAESTPSDATGETASETEAATPSGLPVDRGGALVYAIDQDTLNPWAHYRASCTTACLLVLGAITDTLFAPPAPEFGAVDEAGVRPEGEEPDDLADPLTGVGPNLIERWESNDAGTEHRWTVRSDVTFHDGEPLDAAAVKANLDACRHSPLTGPALSAIERIRANGQELTITTSSPWFPITATFAAGPCAHMFSPAWLHSLADVPARTEGAPFFDPRIAEEPPTGDPAAPIGTGSFRFESYTPGNGNSFIATANPDYWRGSTGSTGERLPYLDRIEFVVATDAAARVEGLEAGAFHAAHTTDLEAISAWSTRPGSPVLSSRSYAATDHVVFNVAAGTNETLAALRGIDEPVVMDPAESNADNPLVQLSCREALAQATPTDANGPFPPGSVGHLDDTGFPAFDPVAAGASLEQCLVDAEVPALSFTLSVADQPTALAQADALVTGWREVLGPSLEVDVRAVEPGQYGGVAITGSFDALLWNNYGTVDVDTEFLWWFSGTAAPVGAVASNIGRFQDPAIDEQLVIQRSSSEARLRREAAEAINEAFAANVWNLWLNWETWGVLHTDQVRGLSSVADADQASIGATLRGGVHDVSALWCVDAICGS